MVFDYICYCIAINRYSSMYKRYGLKILMLPGSGFWCLGKHYLDELKTKRKINKN